MRTLLFICMIFGFHFALAQEPDITYLDGNGNMYEIYEGKIKYAPIKKENSSSGEYSGGKPGEFTLTKKQSKKLNGLLNDAKKAKDDHIKNREMGTGMVIEKTKNGEKSYILKMSSEPKMKLEEFLKSIVNP